jgi:hypothetical protein
LAKPFKIGIINKRSGNAIVYSTNYLRLDEYIDDVALVLKQRAFKGTVIFDLLLSNGQFNRFVEIDFIENKFNKRSIRKINNINSEIAIKSSIFYSKNINYLSRGILSKNEQYSIIEELEKSKTT